MLSTVNADQWTADLLDIDPGQAIFHIERLMRLADGTPVEYGFSRYRGGDRAVIDSRVVCARRAAGAAVVGREARIT